MKIISLSILILLSGCASYNHNQIVSKNNAIDRELGIPNYGVSNRTGPITDAAHGALWWIATDKLKDVLNK